MQLKRALASRLAVLAVACCGRSALDDGSPRTDRRGGPSPSASHDAADAPGAVGVGAATPDAGTPDSGCDACGPLAASVAVLFGGLDSSNTALGDTWEWDGQAWTERAVDGGPPARWGHAMATLNGKVVLFGGRSDSAFFADTWEWDGTSWTDKTPAAGPSPSARDLHAMATLSGKVVLYGGHVLSVPDGGSVARGGSESAYADTWEWEGASWTVRQAQGSTASNPFIRTSPAMATLSDVVVLFGGSPIVLSGALGDTWIWGDSTGWTSPSLSNSPPSRFAHGMSTLGGKIVLFGGFDGHQAYFDDTWTWDGAAWGPVATTGPGARAAFSLATRGGGQVVLFGGYDGTRALSDTWEWDGLAWSQRSAGGPSARQAAALSAR